LFGRKTDALRGDGSGDLASLDSNVGSSVATVRADGDIHKVNHVIIVMQEYHSFDNCFGALPYDPAGPYHGGPGSKNDHSCVDGLTCTVDSSDNFTCANSNPDAEDNSIATAFHDPRYCTGADLDHSWSGSHFETDFEDPAGTLLSSPNDGFVRRNDTTSQGQPDSGPETADSDETMGFTSKPIFPSITIWRRTSRSMIATSVLSSDKPFRTARMRPPRLLLAT
jgi:phospholipase C